mgnify:CR=1 FL=1
MALKVWGVLFNKTNKEYNRKASHLERRAFEVHLCKEVSEILQGQVTVVCIEVDEADLGVMMEVVNEPEVMERFDIRQLENPYQFMIARRETQIF